MLQIGTDHDFAAVRDLLIHANYHEAEFCARLGIASLSEFEEEFDRVQIDDFRKDAHGVLIQLFVEGKYVDEALARERFGEQALTAMASLGMLQRNPASDGEICSTIALYPTAGVWVASDRWNNPDREPYQAAVDIVYPAIVSNAQRFLKFMPTADRGAMLELCSGTAVAAVRAATQGAEHAWAIDITERSTLFADFNARLNGASNVTALQGDLYAPAEGRQFDFIVAHPPYVPVLRAKWIYHDGGDDGEQILRRCVEGVPAHLAPGGIFYLLAMSSDRKDAAYEQRVRGWLGESEGEFDVAAFVSRSLEPDDFAMRAVFGNDSAQNDMRTLRELFRSLGVQQMVYAVLMIQRRSEARPVFTVRRQMDSSATGHDVMAAIQWETAIRRPGGLNGLVGARLKANPETELHVRHSLTGEGWEIESYQLKTSRPFTMEAKTDQWAPYLISQCDGSKTVAEHFQELMAQDVLPEGTEPREFARALSVLVSGGFLHLVRE